MCGTILPSKKFYFHGNPFFSIEIASFTVSTRALQHNRRKEVLARAKRSAGQLSMIGFCGSKESRRQHNTNFQTRLQEARRANLPTVIETPNTSDGDRSPEGRPPAGGPPD